MKKCIVTLVAALILALPVHAAADEMADGATCEPPPATVPTDLISLCDICAATVGLHMLLGCEDTPEWQVFIGMCGYLCAVEVINDRTQKMQEEVGKALP